MATDKPDFGTILRDIAERIRANYNYLTAWPESRQSYIDNAPRGDQAFLSSAIPEGASPFQQAQYEANNYMRNYYLGNPLPYERQSGFPDTFRNHIEKGTPQRDVDKEMELFNTSLEKYRKQAENKEMRGRKRGDYDVGSGRGEYLTEWYKNSMRPESYWNKRL